MPKNKKKHSKSSSGKSTTAVTTAPQVPKKGPVAESAVNVAASEAPPICTSPLEAPTNPPIARPSTVIEDKAAGPVAMAPSNEKASGDVVVTETSTETHVVAAARTLLQVIEEYNGTTVNGLISELNAAKKNYEKTRASEIQTKCKLAVDSALNQFFRYATLNLSSIEAEDVSKCREQMLSEGLKYLKRCEGSIDKISRWAVTLIFDGARILVHSDSLVVLETLRSVPKNIYFSVFIVIDNDSVKGFFKDNYNIDVKTIRDAEVGTLMESMDLVMVGAEAVLKNGGILNKVGTLPLAICAKEMNKPMYVLAESFKFSLLYPMNQMDIQPNIRVDSTGERIRIDYTLPKYITFLVTDRGLLTPTAVCDELIELYT